jgi:hypothetical protein
VSLHKHATKKKQKKNNTHLVAEGERGHVDLAHQHVRVRGLQRGQQRLAAGPPPAVGGSTDGSLPWRVRTGSLVNVRSLDTREMNVTVVCGPGAAASSVMLRSSRSTYDVITWLGEHGTPCVGYLGAIVKKNQ